jgi:hypothetical protein
MEEEHRAENATEREFGDLGVINFHGKRVLARGYGI